MNPVKSIAIALIVAHSTVCGVSAQSVVTLTAYEQARVVARGGDLQGCVPYERTSFHRQEVVHIRCAPAANGVFIPDAPPELWRVYSATGVVERETRPTLKARLKTAVLYIVGGIITAIYIYGKAQQ